MLQVAQAEQMCLHLHLQELLAQLQDCEEVEALSPEDLQLELYALQIGAVREAREAAGTSKKGKPAENDQVEQVLAQQVCAALHTDFGLQQCVNHARYW